MYRHSLFFLEHERATVAREYVEGTLDGLDGLKAEDTDILENKDERLVFELRFSTQRKLDHYEENMLLAAAGPNSYAINCEDY